MIYIWRVSVGKKLSITVHLLLMDIKVLNFTNQSLVSMSNLGQGIVYYEGILGIKVQENQQTIAV